MVFALFFEFDCDTESAARAHDFSLGQGGSQSEMEAALVVAGPT